MSIFEVENSHRHYNDVIMGAMASQITSLTSVYSTIDSGLDQRKHQRSASLAFVRGIRREPVNSTHKWSVTRKMFPFDDVIMNTFLSFHRPYARISVSSEIAWGGEPLMIKFLVTSMCRHVHWVNTLRPRRNEQHFADDIFKRIFFNENVWFFD